jgi:aldehyde:ferredoxin oxidoreductase
VEFEDRLTVFDTLVLCRFYRDLYTWERLGEMIRAVTGLASGKQDLRAIAAAVSTLIRRFNIREGLVRNDDRLSPALHRAVEDSGKNITEDELAYMVGEYYGFRGWDEGIPPMETQ